MTQAEGFYDFNSGEKIIYDRSFQSHFFDVIKLIQKIIQARQICGELISQ